MEGENTEYNDDKSWFSFADLFLFSALYDKSDTNNGSVMFCDLQLIGGMIAGLTSVFLLFSGLIFVYQSVISNLFKILILCSVVLCLTVLHIKRRK